MKSTWYRVAVVGILALAAVAVVGTRSPSTDGPAAPAGIPRLLELGSVTCIPCKMMEPVLDELRREYPGKLQVDFVDVVKEKQVAQQFGIEVIPTQVFFDAKGKEVFRHTGFFAKADILAAFEEHGIALPRPGTGP